MQNTYKKLIKNDKLNTSYPICKEDWLKFKSDRDINFDEKEICYYIHIPFCKSKCKFCEYIKYIKPEKSLEDKYIDILIKDIKTFSEKHKNIVLKGLDIGGGTPTCLEYDNLKRLLDFLKEELSKMTLSEDFEPSIESTFLTIDEEKIKLISNSGIKRISFGLQTVNKKFLKKNSRPNPTLERMKDVLALCHKNGVKKVNIDLMYGLERQSKNDLKSAIKTIEILKPEQVTLYEFRTNILNIKEYKSKKQLFNEYYYLYKNLLKLGYKGIFGQNTFSIYDDFGLSSYIKNRMIKNISYKGFGISAQSKSKEGVTYNIGKGGKSLQECLEEGHFDCEDSYILPKEEMLAKYIAISGYCGRFNLNIMQEILGEDPLNVFKEQFDFLLGKKLIHIKDNTVFFTRKGFVHYGAILSLFYPVHQKN